MDILSFSKITKPIYEGGTTINLRPKGKWLIEVRRTDGTIRRPFGDMWIDNLFLNAYVNPQFTNGGGYSWGNVSSTTAWSFLDLFYGAKSSIAVGSGTTAVTQSDTTLANEIRNDSTAYASGNSISLDTTSGNLIWTIKESFPSETASVTYNEAGIRITGSGTSTEQMNGLTTNGSNRIINRVVFPSSVILTTGEELIITIAVTVPSLASSAGKTITISAQNGVNISGVLKCIATQASMAGGTITAGGTASRDTTYPLLFSTTQSPVALLSTKTAFDTLGVNPTWGTTNQVTGSWATYTTNNRYRDASFQWGSGTPASDTAFRSILFRTITTAGATGGYQLLLDAEQTKASTATLALSLRFSL